MQLVIPFSFVMTALLLHSSCKEEPPPQQKTESLKMIVEATKPYTKPGAPNAAPVAPAQKEPQAQEDEFNKYPINLTMYFDIAKFNCTIRDLMLQGQMASTSRHAKGVDLQYMNQFLYLNPEFSFNDVDPLPVTTNGQTTIPPSPTLQQVMEKKRAEMGDAADIILLDGKYYPIVFPDCILKEEILSKRLNQFIKP